MKPIRFPVAVLLAIAGAAGSAPAWAADQGKTSPAQRDYQQERARCLRGESAQPRATCLQEAAAAYAEARRGRLPGAAAAELERNATQRCDAQPAADREACVQRILGGNSQGSVEGGGLIRRSETTTR